MKKNKGLIMALLIPFTLTGCNYQEKESMKKIYTLQEAYNEGTISRTDLMHIVYFMNGEVFEFSEEVDNIVKIDFEPHIAIPSISEIEEKTIEDIKKTFYNENQQQIDDEVSYLNKSIDIMETINIVSFLGKYSGAYALQVDTTLMANGDGSFDLNIGGIVWTQFGPEIIIYK